MLRPFWVCHWAGSTDINILNMFSFYHMLKWHLLGDEQTFTNKIYCLVYFDACSTYYLVTGHKHGRTLPPHRSIKHQINMACQTLHYSMFLYFYWILLHYYCIFWDFYLISGHFYSICFVSILYSMICIQYIRLFLLYNFRLYFIFSNLHCIFLDLYLISGHFYSILLHYCIFLDLYLISGHFYYT